MRLTLLNLRAILALVVWLRVTDARRDYQIALNFENATASAQSSATKWATYWYTRLEDVWSNCDFYDPGRWGARSLESGDRTGGHEGAGASAGAPALRGSDAGSRSLQVSCPSTGSKRGSSKCQSIGCAFCGRCDRSRHLQTSNTTAATRLTPEAALKLEDRFNSYLARFCYGARGCLIYAKIYLVFTNGTAYPLSDDAIAV